jgi:outer membrane protein TolC
MKKSCVLFSIILLTAGTVPAVGQEKALSLSLRESVLSALENNPSLRAQRYAADAKSTAEMEEEGAYDPVLSGGVSAFRTLQDPGNDFVTGGSANAGISLPLPSGTGVSAGVRAGRETTTTPANTPYFGMDISVTQSLLRGGLDIQANLAGVRKARLDTFASRFELKGFTESLVFNVENAYWTYYLADRQAEIYRESLRLAEQHVENTRRRIQVGTLPALDLAAAQVEVAVRRETLIGAEGRAETARLKLLQLAGPRVKDFWDLPVQLLDRPSEPDYRLDTVKSHVELALKSRPDLGQARLALEKGELDVVRTKNGLLPKLDLFIALGATGYADSFGAAAGNLFDERARLSGGLTFSYPLGNSAARARSERAAASLSQAREALRNLEALVELDIRTAYVEVDRTRAQISASVETARLQEEKLMAETEKYQVGRSTSYAVAQAQRDLLQARLGEAQSVVNHLTALLTLFKQEGTLLERRGIETII